MIPQILTVDEHVENLKAMHGFDLYSRDFIFGNDGKNTRLRNQLISLEENGPITLLKAMLRYGLDETKRTRLFPNPYHLGSLKRLSLTQSTLMALAKKVQKEKHDFLPKDIQRAKPLNAYPESLKKEFESITNALKEITGRRFGQYEDKQNSIRVIYLIDRMMADSEHAFERREKRLLTFIKTPKTRFSFEARDTYPITESVENTFLLNDLKAYFGIEIDIETLGRIDSVFSSLIERVSSIRSHLDKVAFSSRQYQLIPDDYRALHKLVATIAVPQPTSSSRKAARLDYDLYLHLNRFEFLHFAGAHSEILDKARPPSSIATIRDEMIGALSILTNGTRNYFNTTEANFWLSAFPEITTVSANLFLDLIERSLGFRPNDTAYAKCVSLSHELLYRVRMFSSDRPLPRELIKISFRNIVSALCATSQALKCRVDYRPAVYGDNSQTRSTITPLETVIDFDGDVPPKEIPEGYLQFWHHRREWVQYALEGGHEIVELKFGLRKLLWKKISECVQPNDITVIEHLLSKIESDLLNTRFVN